MADIIESREFRKRRLKEDISDETFDTGEGDKKPSLMVFVLIILCIAAAVFGVWYFYTTAARYEYRTDWSRSTDNADGSIDTFRDYRAFAGGIIKYTRDGAEYIDRDGNAVWERSYEMDQPIVDASSSYAVIADQGSANIYIFSTTELVGTSETLLPISLVRISDNGVVYAVLNDSEAEYIYAFRSDGSSIDLSVKSVFSGDGYPFDLDTSPDGTQLITSYAGIENGVLANNVVFRNFGSVGQNEDSRRIVGGFKEEFEGHLAGRVRFANNEYSQAFYDGGIVFFSTKVLNSPEILANVAFEEEMLRIAYNESLTAVLLKNDSVEYTDNSAGNGESPDASRYRLVILNNKGSITGDIYTDSGGRGMCVSKNSIILYDSSRITVYNKKGGISAELDYADGGIVSIEGSGKSGSLYVLTGSDINRISF